MSSRIHRDDSHTSKITLSDEAINTISRILPRDTSLEDENDLDPIELPTEEDGTLLLSTVTAQFPGASGLKFKSATGSTRGLRLLDGAFHAPPGTGWDNINFIGVAWSKVKCKAVGH
ncbi:hypothetical protein M8J77_010927 [Diaphorina citri]|nr:hypothetical protein M8J77_010927 [Diaphorina citri]